VSENFDFDSFIAGTNLPRFEVPLYGVVHQRRIDELDTKIEAASEEPAGDERESSVSPVPEMVAERDRLHNEQEASARWVELRTLSAQEFSEVANDAEKDVLDQIAAMSKGTRNEGDRDKWAAAKAAALPGAWTLFIARANEILEQTLVMPDFSLNGSKTPRGSSAN
jgi:hypothetical protein